MEIGYTLMGEQRSPKDLVREDDAVDALPVEWDVDLGPGAHASVGRADGVRPTDKLHHFRQRHPEELGRSFAGRRHAPERDIKPDGS